MKVKDALGKVNWKRVAKIGGCVVAGVVAFTEAIGEQKKAERFEGFEKRLSKLEGKES